VEISHHQAYFALLKTVNCSNIVIKLHCDFLLLQKRRVVKNEQQARAHKTTRATSRGYKETYNTQTKQVDDTRVYKRFYNLKNVKKTFKQKACKQNFSELTEENYNVAW
jgi:hypothetical protein